MKPSTNKTEFQLKDFTNLAFSEDDQSGDEEHSSTSFGKERKIGCKDSAITSPTESASKYVASSNERTIVSAEDQTNRAGSVQSSQNVISSKRTNTSTFQTTESSELSLSDGTTNTVSRSFTTSSNKGRCRGQTCTKVITFLMITMLVLVVSSFVYFELLDDPYGVKRWFGFDTTSEGGSEDVNLANPSDVSKPYKPIDTDWRSQNFKGTFLVSLLILNEDYIPEYSMRNSSKFQITSRKLENYISSLFYHHSLFNSTFQGANLICFTNGSLVATLQLRFVKPPALPNSAFTLLPTKEDVIRSLLRETCKVADVGEHSTQAVHDISCDSYWLRHYKIERESLSNVVDVADADKITTMNSTYGVIASPNAMFGKYRPHERCEWRIVGHQSAITMFTIIKFETEKDYDVLSIYKGVNSERVLAARLSGQLAEQQHFMVASSQISITFLSDAVLQADGFVLSYRLINNYFPSSEGCFESNLVINSPSGGFTSAGYPHQYPNNLFCRWIILVDRSKVIKFFLKDFKTRNANDILTIYLVDHNRTQHFESFYGENSNKEVITSSNQAIVIFQSNSILRDRGFHVTFESTEPVACPEQFECPDQSCIPLSFVCDGTPDCFSEKDELLCDSNCNGLADKLLYKGFVIELSSMNYPKHYNPTSNCSWRLTAQERHLVIELSFVDFSTETPYDKLTVLEGIGRNATIVDVFSGETFPSILTSSTNKVTVLFESDETIQARGFKLRAMAKLPGTCPGRHDCGNENCIPNRWLCDGTMDCADGNDEKLCESGCGGTSDMSVEGHVTTPRYPDMKYKDELNCVWRVRAPNNKTLISLDFLNFATEDKFDFLQIFEGIGRNKTLKATLSGTILPPTYVSKSSSITLTFTSDRSVSNLGFNISVKWMDGGRCPGQFACDDQTCVDWSDVCNEVIDCANELDEQSCPSKCGGQRDLTNSAGWFATLYHPSYYPDNLKCVWRIKANPFQLIQLEFESFHTESNADTLKIYNGLGREKLLYNWYGGNRIPIAFRSKYHLLTLEFISDATVNRPGFNISYYIGFPNQLKACGNFGSNPTAIGMEDGGVKDFQITASSSLSRHWVPSKGRLHNKNGAWASASVQPRRLQWLQIDFLKFRLVTGITTQGFSIRYHFFVTSFMIQHSYDGMKWRRYSDSLDQRSKIFSANIDSTSAFHNSFDHPFAARYIRIIPRTWIGSSIVMRVEVYACEAISSQNGGQEGCNRGEFECGNGACIRRSQVCDGTPHCEDRSDEKGCTRCRWNQYECTSGECIDLRYRCDETLHCLDGSDEVGCSTCREGDFLCFDESSCISRKWRCDGYADCADFSDERRCNHTWLCDIMSDHRCNDGACISGVNVRCNGVNECRDKSDELDCKCGVRFFNEESNGTRYASLSQGSEILHRVPRIVGGSVAKPHSWPWQVSLRRGKSGNHFCGGTIIDKRWVVTAAHCLIKLSPSDILLKVGLHSRKTDFENTRTHHAKEIIMHPRYDDQSYDFDIAMIELKENLVMTNAVNIICIPPKSHVFYPAQNCWVTGWGTIYSDGPLSRSLQEAEVSLIENKICNRPMWYNGKLTPRMICAGRMTGGVDACQGDSGGPLVCQERGEGRWFLAGVVSWGTGCGGFLKPGIYTKVTELSHWIKEVMEESAQ